MSTIDQKLRTHISSLIEEGEVLAIGTDEYNLPKDAKHASQCTGWIAAASNVVKVICTDVTNSYRTSDIHLVLESQLKPGIINRTVGSFTELLKRLLSDAENGLISSIASQASAEALDDLLDLAIEYHSLKRIDGSSIISTAVFEDTVRRIVRRNGIIDKDVKTDTLITILAKKDIISSITAKRCRAAAGVRKRVARSIQRDKFK
jgi:hypothetical protein